MYKNKKINKEKYYKKYYTKSKHKKWGESVVAYKITIIKKHKN